MFLKLICGLGVKKMMKPMEYVIELNDREAKAFLEEYYNPKPNPGRDKFIADTKALYEKEKCAKQ